MYNTGYAENCYRTKCMNLHIKTAMKSVLTLTNVVRNNSYYGIKCT